METFTSLALLVISLLFIRFLLKFMKGSESKLPSLPGPSTWKTFRGFVKFGHDYHSLFTHWKGVYGNIYCCTLGLKKLVVLNDHKSIKDSFNNVDLQGKPEMMFINPLHFPKSGITRNDGESWAYQRKITSRHLRNFGFAKGNTEKLIMDEVQELLSSLKNFEGAPTNANKQFFFNVMNAVWIIMGGLRLTNDRKDLPKKILFNTFLDTSEEVDANPFIAFIPSLVKWFPWIPVWKKYQGEAVEVRKFLAQLVVDHKATVNEQDGMPTDFVYAYLKKDVMKKNKEREEAAEDNSEKIAPEDIEYDPEAEQQLEALLFDFIYAGFETTSTSMDWVIYHLVRNIECQTKLQDELDKVVGHSRLPTLLDKQNLPYFEACLLESFRLTPIHPVGLMHQATADTTINGCHVTKGSTIIPNVYAAHTDPTLVDDPLEFKPERFLGINEEGKLAAQVPQYLMPFGTGKRICLGEFLAKDTLWLFLSAIYQNFDVRPHPIGKTPGLKEADAGILYAPPKFQVQFIKRSVKTN